MDIDILVLKFRIGEAVAKRIDDIQSLCVEVTVADIDIFRVVFLKALPSLDEKVLLAG